MEKFLSSVGDSADPVDPEVKEPINAFARSTTVTGRRKNVLFVCPGVGVVWGVFWGGRSAAQKLHCLFCLSIEY